MKSIRASSLVGWFLALLLLNLADIATTIPVYESNPVTLYLWGRIGVLLSAWVKIGLVGALGALCLAANSVAAPDEWASARKIFLGMMIILVVYYSFVVAINLRIVLLSAFP